MNLQFMKRSHAHRVEAPIVDGVSMATADLAGFGLEGRAATRTEVRNSNPSGVRGSKRVSQWAFRMVALLAILFIGSMAFVTSVSAQNRTDSNGNTVYHPIFVVAQYQMGDFDFAKESGSYGLGVVASSISHWGRFHVGANVNFSLNAGFVDNWGCIIDLGPSARVDINNRFFVNVPVNAVCNVIFPEGSTDTETAWGARIAPSIHAFISDRFGLFAGPQLSIGFSDGSDVSFGFQAGLSYAF